MTAINAKAKRKVLSQEKTNITVKKIILTKNIYDMKSNINYIEKKCITKKRKYMSRV